uniref:Uncharacterized protein n=1 Tax=Arcella intermedia TaxID=1963864 RepID=A0A6B2LFY2_9EUKA
MATALENTVKAYPNLSDIVKLELFEASSPERCTEIWTEYHKTKYCVNAVATKVVYQQLRALLEIFPVFVLPILKQGGSEFFATFYKDNAISFIRLEEWKKLKTNATSALTVMHYTELMESKEIVFMRGEIDPYQINVQEAQFLVNQLQIFYLDREKLRLVMKFNQEPNNFDYNLLLNYTLPKESLPK